MDIAHLASFYEVVLRGSFSAAARALYTVQSNVSGHIARLEKELGVVLVDRQRGGLTDEGMAVVERARRVLHELDDIAADMASRGDEVTGEARLEVRSDLTGAELRLPAPLGTVAGGRVLEAGDVRLKRHHPPVLERLAVLRDSPPAAHRCMARNRWCPCTVA